MMDRQSFYISNLPTIKKYGVYSKREVLFYLNHWMWVSLNNQLQTFILVINMSEKRIRLSNGDKIAILEAIRIPGYKKEEIMKQYNIGKTAF